MKIYEVTCNETNSIISILETDAINALITVVINNRYKESFVNHQSYRNSVKRRIKKVNGYLKVYNFSVKIG